MKGMFGGFARGGPLSIENNHIVGERGTEILCFGPAPKYNTTKNVIYSSRWTGIVTFEEWLHRNQMSLKTSAKALKNIASAIAKTIPTINELGITIAETQERLSKMKITVRK